MNYNIKVDNNKKRVVESKKGKEALVTKDLKQINF
jgi:hypothetical protein